MTDKEILEKLRSICDVKKIYGPYTSKDGRKRIVFYKSDESTASMAWARAKVIAHEGRYLTDEEEVDHIDEDPTNDDISNLQILSLQEHREKSGRQTSLRTNKRTIEQCPYCSVEFECKAYRKLAAVEKNKFVCCSRSCASRLYGKNQYM
jgi:hypothetical protein